MKNVLVTGGAGFIGSALVRGLLKERDIVRVVVVDNLLTGRTENLDDVRQEVEFRPVDIRNYDALEPLFEGIDIVFHQAAIPSVARSILEPQLTHGVNVDGTFNVLLAAQRKGVQRVIYASSSSVYGDTETLPKTERMVPSPKSPYAIHKLFGEYYARSFWELHRLETVGLRYFNVFGPHQDPASQYSGVLSRFCKAILESQPPQIYGDGEQSRDFTFVDNIVRLNILASRSPKAPGNVYNGGVGARVTLNRAWALLQNLDESKLDESKLGESNAERKMTPQYLPPRAADVRHSQADLTSAAQDIGYEPVVGFEEGLKRTLDWYRHSAKVSLKTATA